MIPPALALLYKYSIMKVKPLPARFGLTDFSARPGSIILTPLRADSRLFCLPSMTKSTPLLQCTVDGCPEFHSNTTHVTQLRNSCPVDTSPCASALYKSSSSWRNKSFLPYLVLIFICALMNLAVIIGHSTS